MGEPILDVGKRADAFFMQRSPIHAAMQRLANAFGETEIPFAIAGAMAANAHGHKRTTADVNILIDQKDLERFKSEHIGRGWIDKLEGSKNFRDTSNAVDIDTLLVGNYPGDGLPKPVAFPEPEAAREMRDGLPFVSLKTLLELKLACGMTTTHRPRDLDDVIQLIKVNQLDLEYASELNAYVRPKYNELWQSAQVDDDY